MAKKIKTIILDWAGTTIDYGCFAPVDAFIKAFEAFDITPTMEETRAPMGLQKRIHIEKMLKGERLATLWKEKYNRSHTKDDIDKIYHKFEDALFSVLSDYTDPLPGVLDAVEAIREMGISIGSTTGYTQTMMDVVMPLAKKKGYAPDYMVAPDTTGGIGRPYPYMIWHNLEKLVVSSIHEVVKVGDTAADMEEGKNAGCLCVGIIKGSSILGLTESELAEKSSVETAILFEKTKQKYIKSGADYVIEDITILPGLIKELGEKNHA